MQLSPQAVLQRVRGKQVGQPVLVIATNSYETVHLLVDAVPVSTARPTGFDAALELRVDTPEHPPPVPSSRAARCRTPPLGQA